MINSLNELDVLTLFVDDLPAATDFYTRVFGLEVVYQDDVSAMVQTFSPERLPAPRAPRRQIQERIASRTRPALL